MKTNNHELITKICDSLPADPDMDGTVCLDYDWLYRQIEELCVPVSKVEELIKQAEKMSEHIVGDIPYEMVLDCIAIFKKLIDKAKQ